ncbi:MAG: hypothetical protein ACKO4K_01020 [Flavobacteriales bacterium]
MRFPKEASNIVSMLSRSLHRCVFVLLVSCVGYGVAQDQVLSLGGYYQGLNLFISNPIKADGYGYCVQKVLVNGNVLPASIQSDYVEINLALFDLKKGDEIFVELDHGAECSPRFVNPEVLLPLSTFVINSLSATPTGKVTWVASNESGKLNFMVEQFKWGRWVAAGEVQGKGTRSANTYTLSIIPTSGKNKIRISQIDNTGQTRSSQPVTFQASQPAVIKTPAKVKSMLYFKTNGKAAKTKFELYDAYGNLLIKGYDSQINCSSLLNGIYYINFDNKSEKIIKY